MATNRIVFLFAVAVVALATAEFVASSRDAIVDRDEELAVVNEYVEGKGRIKPASGASLLQNKIVTGIEEIEKKLTDLIIEKSQAQETKIAELQASLTAVQAELEERRVADEEKSALADSVSGIRYKLAFSAYLSRFVSGSANTIVFDSVVLNEGMAYNPYTGIFTVPISGVYQFSFFVMATPYAGLDLKLMVGGVQVSSVYVDVARDSHQKDGGNIVIVKADKGQQVKLVRHSGTGGIHSWPTARTSSFSGFLLYVE